MEIKVELNIKNQEIEKEITQRIIELVQSGSMDDKISDAVKDYVNFLLEGDVYDNLIDDKVAELLDPMIESIKENLRGVKIN